MATDDEVKTDAGGSTLLPGHLETDALAADGVVSLHHALLLEAENLIEIDTAEGDEGAGGIGGRPCELDVIARHEAIGKIAVRRVDGSHSLDAQFIHETTLERAVHALAAPPGLGSAHSSAWAGSVVSPGSSTKPTPSALQLHWNVGGG